jgi:hypothetical protein
LCSRHNCKGQREYYCAGNHQKVYCADCINETEHEKCPKTKILNPDILTKIAMKIDVTFKEFLLQDQTFDISGEILYYQDNYREWYKNWKGLQEKVDYDTTNDKYENFKALVKELNK